jgi:hypothetical protein
MYSYLETRGSKKLDMITQLISLYSDFSLFNVGKSKCKAIPLQAWTDPEVPRSLRLPDFKIIGA